MSEAPELTPEEREARRERMRELGRRGGIARQAQVKAQKEAREKAGLQASGQGGDGSEFGSMTAVALSAIAADTAQPAAARVSALRALLDHERGRGSTGTGQELDPSAQRRLIAWAAARVPHELELAPSLEDAKLEDADAAKLEGVGVGAHAPTTA